MAACFTDMPALQAIGVLVNVSLNAASHSHTLLAQLKPVILLIVDVAKLQVVNTCGSASLKDMGDKCTSLEPRTGP